MSPFAQSHSAPPPNPPRRAPAHFLALGDSYTIGEGVAREQSWPERLSAALVARAHTVAAPRIVATTGWTIEELLTGMESSGVWPSTSTQALVTLAIGVNDQFRGQPLGDTMVSYARVFDRAVALTGGHAARVVCVSIPDWGITPFAAGRDRARIATELDALNAAEAAHARAHGAHVVDVTTLTRRHGEDPAFLAADGLHPGPAAYAEWAEAIRPAAERALRGTRPRQD